MIKKNNKFVNYFKLLGVSVLDGENKIKQAYYNKAKVAHPDRGGKEEDFKILKKAYDVLKTESTKHKYIMDNLDDLFFCFYSNETKRVVVNPKKTGCGTATQPFIINTYETIFNKNLNTVFYVDKKEKEAYKKVFER